MARRKRHALRLFAMVVLVISLLAIAVIVLSMMREASMPVIEENVSIDVYFCPRDMCMEKMIDAIGRAEDVKCAFYELNLPELITVLEEKGADVVIEDSNRMEQFHSGYSSALMHNKFCILDSEVITTGSMNPTENCNYRNNNNLLIIRSRTLAQNYLDEFSELREDAYGRGGKVMYPQSVLGGIPVENYFCPEDNCKLHVIDALKSANESIYFMTFSFTDKDIGNLIWNKRYEGLDVRGIFEERQQSDYSRYDDLKDFSILDRNKYTMHHKVFIIDNKTVITGSFNPSANANERNDENVIIIHDKAIAKLYFDEFSTLFYGGDDDPVQGEVVMSRVVYDYPGKDEGNEYIEVMNSGGSTIDLSYYHISSGKGNMQLEGMISPGDTVLVKPRFSLPNSNGSLTLLHNSEAIDAVFWEGRWSHEAGEGYALVREDPLSDEEQAWAVAAIR